MRYIYDWDELPVVEALPGVFRRVISGRHVQMTYVRYGPGATVAEHRHPQEQILFVLEGELWFKTEDEERVMKAGHVVVVPGNALHAAHSDGGAVFVEAFSPIRLSYFVGFVGDD